MRGFTLSYALNHGSIGVYCEMLCAKYSYSFSVHNARVNKGVGSACRLRLPPDITSLLPKIVRVQDFDEAYESGKGTLEQR